MKPPRLARRPLAPELSGARGFSLVEMLVVMAVIAILAALLLPALAQVKGRAHAMTCMSNSKQLVLAWHLYASDNAERLPYNLGMVGSAFRTDLNWVNNVLTWDTSADNTNTATLTKASLGVFVGGNPAVYRCPADQTLSSVQQAAGWTARNRSYAMNAMVGDAGIFSTNGFNVNNPAYKQFFKITQIPQPASIFVFLDEHPDSINDGYFLNRAPQNYASAGPGRYYGKWTDLPASYHSGAATFAYADGHALLHRWRQTSTVQPLLPNAANLPIAISSSSASAVEDFNWVLEHMSVYSETVTHHE
jgi:prepilin-type N-terminal cleavage/methylation domain-containing protein/prepilin-type processing-associated H-X9-DG protein